MLRKSAKKVQKYANNMPIYLKSFQNNAPTFRCLPDFVKGIPILREIFCFARVIPKALFQLNPPKFILPF